MTPYRIPPRVSADADQTVEVTAPAPAGEDDRANEKDIQRPPASARGDDRMSKRHSAAPGVSRGDDRMSKKGT